MKSVLISIQPKWCELIANGEKTVEVRKTKPKLETPFKVYIYMTKEFNRGGNSCFYWYKNGKVIGEFVCECVTSLKADNIVQAYYNNTQATCLTDTEIMEYAKGGKLYYWHISDLVIYDKPRELSEFKHECNGICFDTKARINCERFLKEGFSCDNLNPLKRPPQSWCYVESEVEGD